MSIIIPAILPTSRHDLEEKLARLVGIATDVQIDIVDGKFAEPATWPYASGREEFAEASARGESLPYAESFAIEIDLMVRDPEQMTGSWITAGATRILAHLESTTYLPKLVTDLKVKYGHEKGFASESLSFGLALNIGTNLELIEPYIDDIDYVQFMGIKNIGKQGQSFATEVLNKIAVFRRTHEDMPIQIDGGVNLESAALLLNAGASRLIVGSALWKAPDLKSAYEEFVSLTENHGLYGSA